MASSCEIFHDAQSSFREEDPAQRTPESYDSNALHSSQRKNNFLTFSSKVKKNNYPPIMATSINLNYQTNSESVEYQNFKLLQEISLYQKQKSLNWIMRFSEDLCYLSISGTSGDIFIYNLIEASKSFISDTPETILHGHTSEITDLTWNKEGNLVSCGNDCMAFSWKISREQPSFQYLHQEPVTACRFFVKSQQNFITSSKDNLLRLFQLNLSKPLAYYQVPSNVNCLEMDPEGFFLAVGLCKGEISVYSIREDCRLRFFNTVVCKNKRGIYSNGRKVVSLKFIDDQLLIASTADNRIRVMKFKEGIMLHKFKSHKSLGSPIPVQYSAENGVVMTGSEDGKIYFWKINSMVLKNYQNENIQIFRNKKHTVYSIFAPNKIVEFVRNRYHDGNVINVIFALAGPDKLKILLIVSKT